MNHRKPRVYLASAFRRQAELRKYALWLDDMGIEVTSRWLEEHSESVDATGRVLKQSIPSDIAAKEDLADIDRADCLISFTEPPDSDVPPRGGRHVEFGYALAKGKELWVVGYRENIFHHVPGVRYFKTWADAMIEAATGIHKAVV